MIFRVIPARINNMTWTRYSCLFFCYLRLVPTLLASTNQSPIGGDPYNDVPWPPPPEDQLDRYIHWLMKGYNVPGLSLAIIDDGKIGAKVGPASEFTMKSLR